MRLGETTFHLYRASTEGAVRDGPEARAPTDDAKLAALFTPAPAKPVKRTKALSAQRMAADAARRALRGEI